MIEHVHPECRGPENKLPSQACLQKVDEPLRCWQEN